MKTNRFQQTGNQRLFIKETQFSIVPLFLFLTFAFSWLLFGVVILIGQPVTASSIFLLLTLGISCPSIVALVIVSWKYDSQKRCDFWQRLLDFRRVRPVWWIISLLGMPVFMTLSAGLDWLLGGELPAAPTLRSLIEQPLGIPVFLLIIFYGGPLSEELGWRGIALPEMERKWGLLRASLVLGLIWWAWHLPAFFIPGSDQFNMGWFTPLFWLFLADILSQNLIISLSYDRNNFSLLAPVLVHFSHNLVFTLAAPVSPRVFAFFILLELILAVGMWLFKKDIPNHPEEQ